MQGFWSAVRNGREIVGQGSGRGRRVTLWEAVSHDVTRTSVLENLPAWLESGILTP